MKKRVLAVDDDEAVRALLERLLSPSYEVSLASDGREALARIAAERPQLVLLDLRMPVLDGWSVIEELDRNEVRVPVVVISAEVGREWPDSPLVRGRLRKPLALRELLALCASLLGEKARR